MEKIIEKPISKITRLVESTKDKIKIKLTPQDFEMIAVLGRGSYAKVVLSEYSGKQYALKIIDKKFVEKFEKIHEVHIEKLILSGLNHHNIIKLHSTFQDNKKLYFVLDYCSRRDLADFLKANGKLDTEIARWFGANIVNALVFLREKGISHRDLKPENIMITEDYTLKLVFFIYSRLISLQQLELGICLIRDP